MPLSSTAPLFLAIAAYVYSLLLSSSTAADVVAAVVVTAGMTAVVTGQYTDRLHHHRILIRLWRSGGCGFKN